MFWSVVLWILTLYGAWALVRHTVSFWRRRHAAQVPVRFVLIVQDSEDGVEGWLRQLMALARNRPGDRGIVVLDVNSMDGTRFIVEAFARRHDEVRYERVVTEGDLPLRLQRWVDGSAITCVVNGRQGSRSAGLEQALAMWDG
ncbi:hypothetical protein GCM10010885_12880 [Alicyclobacillus cellulosilyticus]|uniref:Glycosyl transferase family 2 n=1 Tax=Alicyclobacillus cellulosilyticus TaxID=1003997 RepID=A0A917K8S3_9BACL|nr:hypothetical protein [Alicyclobacillus cellulosilyticus]GGJ05217.1 hypothetical protein GCM10010885_12880 [Alicyclobacillus cellulosilyticus]